MFKRPWYPECCGRSVPGLVESLRPPGRVAAVPGGPSGKLESLCVKGAGVHADDVFSGPKTPGAKLTHLNTQTICFSQKQAPPTPCIPKIVLEVVHDFDRQTAVTVT